ncbi:MAG TPA: PilN domain-containing protein [Vicinamibacterales bacterium]|nr:PilN domain-containing protein [Vicinamibacterales bacterium]
MIRINLLAVERERAKRPRAIIPPGQRVTIGAALIILITLLGVGWWFWYLRAESSRLDADIARAESETTQLRSVLAQVQRFETRKAQLQQRVTLIEQLRQGQTGPVHVLDEVSRSVPDRLWLTTMTQKGSSFTMEGRATSLTALSDFVVNLEGSTWFKRPVEIVDSAVDQNAKVGELVRFTIRAELNDPSAPVVPAKGAGRGRPAPPAAH